MTEQIILDPLRTQVDRNGIRHFTWPLRRAEVLGVRDEMLTGVLEGVRALYRDGYEEPADLLLALCLHLTTETMSLFQAETLVKRYDALGCRIVPAPGSRLLAPLASGGTPAVPPVVHDLVSGPARPKAWRFPLRVARGLLKQAEEPISRHPLFGVDYRRDIVTMALSPLIGRHAAQVGRRVVYRGRHTWFGPAGPTIQAKGDESRILELVIELTRKAFAAAGREPSWSVLDHQYEWFGRALGLARFHLRRLLHHRQRLPKRLWTGPGTHIWTRLLRLAVRKEKGAVVGHDHGTGSGHLVFPQKTAKEMEFCTEFVTLTACQEEGVRQNFERALLVQPDPPQITHVAGPGADTKFDRNHREKPRLRAEPPRLLFVSGLPDGESVHLSPLLPALVTVDWYAHVLHLLAKEDYEVLWKPHPSDSAVIPDRYLEELGIERVTGAIESWYRQVDLLVFDTVVTTALVGAVRTKCPLVVLDVGLEKWRPAARQALERRCAVVHAGYDDRNRVRVDPDEFRAAIDAAPGRTDPSFARDYFSA